MTNPTCNSFKVSYLQRLKVSHRHPPAVPFVVFMAISIFCNASRRVRRYLEAPGAWLRASPQFCPNNCGRCRNQNCVT